MLATVLTMVKAQTKTPNDPSSATRRTGRVDCKPRRHAGFAAAHGYAALGCVLHGPLLFCLRPKAAGRGYIFLS